MDLVQILIFGYIVLIGIFSLNFYLLLLYPDKFNTLRTILGRLYFIKSVKSKDIIYQTTTNGCGHATIQMLCKRRNIVNPLTNNNNTVNFNSPLDMNTMSRIIENTGLKTKGLEFHNKKQLEKYIQLNPNSSSILLMKRYDSCNQFSILTILFCPIILIMELLSRLKLITLTSYHWVLLDDISEEGVIISDSFFGKIFLKSKRFTKSWSKYSLIVNGENNDRSNKYIQILR